MDEEASSSRWYRQRTSLLGRSRVFFAAHRIMNTKSVLWDSCVTVLSRGDFFLFFTAHDSEEILVLCYSDGLYYYSSLQLHAREKETASWKPRITCYDGYVTEGQNKQLHNHWAIVLDCEISAEWLRPIPLFTELKSWLGAQLSSWPDAFHSVVWVRARRTIWPFTRHIACCRAVSRELDQRKRAASNPAALFGGT